METILMYLDNMFLNMPKTPEVLRAREELAAMMEDKYNELLAAGKKENEAIGIVISEFGNLEEVVKELGAGTNAGESRKEFDNESARMVTWIEAEEYMEVSKKSSRWIAVGVLLCIWSPILLILCGGVEEYLNVYGNGATVLSDGAFVVFGLIPLFFMIGCAVGLFIYHGMKLEKFEYLKKENICLDDVLEMTLREQAEEEQSRSTVKIIVGVMMCIFSVLPLLILGSISDNEFYHVLSVVFLLMIVGIAVAFIIIGGNRMECMKILLQEGDYSVRKKESNKLTELIGGIYWPMVTMIYLGWSFFSGMWGFTWVIWPIAGILFGIIAIACEAITQARKRGML